MSKLSLSLQRIQELYYQKGLGKRKKTALYKKALKNLQGGAVRPEIRGYAVLGCFRRYGR
ncbi:MAG: hypothetical protein BGO68_05810 [Candidatus Amoebophilus sp. 36-38]|nr:MAG: hypothetical protein BGO68_05810 [Candidatus Amoebophilus sp. 36-38]